MPHVIVKLYEGRSEEQKTALAEAVTQALMSSLGSAVDSISVGIEDVAPADWMDQVYGPEISSKADSLFKRPGYGPLK